MSQSPSEATPGRLDDRVTIDQATGTAVVRGPGGPVPVAAILDALTAGRSPAQAGAEFGLGPEDLLAALAWDGLGPPDQPRLGLVQAPPSRPALRPALSEAAFAELFPRTSAGQRLALAAGFLQLHDFWEASHEAAQEAEDRGETSVSAYWHGIAHRREPDTGNAAYWFRRVGRHPVLTRLWSRARPLLEESGDPALPAQLAPRGTWDPFGFIAVCASARPGTPVERLARRLQRIEILELLATTLPPAPSPG